VFVVPSRRLLRALRRCAQPAARTRNVVRPRLRARPRSSASEMPCRRRRLHALATARHGRPRCRSRCRSPPSRSPTAAAPLALVDTPRVRRRRRRRLGANSCGLPVRPCQCVCSTCVARTRASVYDGRRPVDDEIKIEKPPPYSRPFQHLHAHDDENNTATHPHTLALAVSPVTSVSIHSARTSLSCSRP
jgi:hypothetical protein